MSVFGASNGRSANNEAEPGFKAFRVAVPPSPATAGAGFVPPGVALPPVALKTFEGAR
jgi:hypothetical protein